MHIHAPKFGFLGPGALNVIGHHRDPQKAHPWQEPHLHTNFGTDPSTGATCAWDEEIKNVNGKLEIKSNAYSEALQYRQDLFAITH